MGTSNLRTERTSRGALVAATVMAVLLTVTSPGYDYHRDELYYRMLTPSWGYVDQPPFIVWLTALTRLIADEPWALRIPATLAAAGSVLVLARITRELGGGRTAQSVCAWGYAFATTALIMAHQLLTSTIDLLVFPAIVLCALRTRSNPRWWLAVGLLGGLATYNRWLVVVLAVGILVGLLVTGGWRRLLSVWVPAAAGLALVVAAPNLIYQAVHGWPQLAMGEALGARNGSEVRPQVPLMLVLMLGPPLLPIWLAGFVGLIRRPAWRDHRWLAVAFVILVGFTFAGGAQIHYLMGLLPVMYAVGCVPVVAWARRESWRRRLVWAAVVSNGAVSVLTALPLVPLDELGTTPIPLVNPVVGETLGWQRQVVQIEAVSAEAGGVPVIASNYGEAGALARYGISPVYSGHNALWAYGPPEGDTVVIVGARLEQQRPLFAECTIRDHLHNGVGIDNEEEGQPVAICRGPVAPWDELWADWGYLA